MSEYEVNLRNAIQALLTAYGKGVGPLDKAHMDYALAASPSVVCALLVELDAVRGDAERYKFWRDRYPVTFAPTEYTPQDVDKLTDAAMSQATESNKL